MISKCHSPAKGTGLLGGMAHSEAGAHLTRDGPGAFFNAPNRKCSKPTDRPTKQNAAPGKVTGTQATDKKPPLVKAEIVCATNESCNTGL